MSRAVKSTGERVWFCPDHMTMQKTGVACAECQQPPAVTLADLRGIAPNCTVDLSSEEFVRQLRDEW